MWDVKLAKQLKKRNNKEGPGPIVGEVISSNPFKASILGGKAFISQEQCVLCRAAIGLAKGDLVVCLPSMDWQTFFIMDRVVG